LEKVEITIKMYPDLQPFVEMAVLLLEGVYEHMLQVSALSDLESTWYDYWSLNDNELVVLPL